MYSIETLIQLLKDDERNIKIIADTFTNMNTKATFIHPLFGEWQATPKKVILQKTTHPTEANLNRKNKNIKTREGGEVLKKTQKTNMEKWGVPFTAMNPRIKRKQEETCLNKYGAKSFLGTPQCIKKSKKTKRELYGDENFNNKEKIKQTCLAKYGVQNVMLNQSIINKGLKTKENKGLITRPRGISWSALAEELGVPRTSLQEFIRTNPGEDSIEEFMRNREHGLSNIEAIIAKEFNVQKHAGAISKYRPDFKIKKTFVNVDGLYWHSQKVKKDKNYHFELRKIFENQGERLLQFRADEIKYKLNIVKSIIDNVNGLTSNKVFARKCLIKNIEPKEANLFLKSNHIMGKSNSRFIGLIQGQTLVAVMGYKVKNNILDIDRFASLIGHSVVGGLSKLIKHLRNQEKTAIKIKYWVDLRYGTGKSLTTIGFKHVRDVQSWQWTDFNKTFNRLACRANEKFSQNEVALQKGWWPIYDAGQRLFELDL